jgi:hypothetical protein
MDPFSPLLKYQKAFLHAEMSKSLTFALQALLVRHEQYMHDAERDRLEMNTKIEKLEADKKELEDVNAKTIEENQGLLDQLEAVNSTLTESEASVKSLEATLHSTRQELRRLEGLASRTRGLEAQFAALELEHEVLQKTVTTSQDEERSAVQRWRKAERRLNDLLEQLERIEREAKEERERHVEVMRRMERQRAIERELDTAVGRLKGAAAYTAGNGKHGSSVVSHFVKDILQDNANLQMGIVELREMLMSSNDEVQILREQLLIHQPAIEYNGDGSGPPTLRAELAPKDPSQVEQKVEPQVVSQALHIHHHYHAPKKEEIRRPKKKRTSLNNALFTPPRHFQSPRTSRDIASTILSQTSVTVPAPVTPTNRWSMQSAQLSDFAPSSVPSSPHSYRNSALFDRYDFDSSRPTSPGSSIDPMSPQFRPQLHKKRDSGASARHFAAPLNFQSHVIHEEQDGNVEDIADLQTPNMPSLDDEATPSDVSRDSESGLQEHNWTPSFQPTLRRTSSHDSILSISGIDIHTLKSRPSQMVINRDNLFRPRTRLGPPSTVMSVETMTSASMITARPTLSRQGHNSTSYLRSTVLANNSDARSISSSGSNEGHTPKTGGWLFSRWGVSPAKSVADLRGSPASLASQQRTVSTPVVDPVKPFMGRSPGINQKGPIPGFIKRVDRTPSKVTTEQVDREALQEVLAEGGLT